MGKADLLNKKAQQRTGEYTQAFNDVKNIIINNIKLNPFQPRKQFNEESIKELAESIKEHGLLQPISITKDNILIAGERRLRASKLLELKEIKCIIIKNVDDKKLEEFAIIENLQREDLDIFDEASAISKLISKSSSREVAKIIGKSRGYVQNRIYLASLSSDDISYIKENNLKLKEMIEISQGGLKKYLSKVDFGRPPENENPKPNDIKNEDENKDVDTLEAPKKTPSSTTTEKKYTLSLKEVKLKKVYEENGFEVFFNKDEMAIRVKKSFFIDAYKLLKDLKKHSK